MRRRMLSLMVCVSLCSFGGLVLGSSAHNAFAQAASAVTITSGQSPEGKVLFTGDGRALYMLTFDTTGTANSPAKSSCTARCLTAWPPLLVSKPVGSLQVQGGVPARGIGTIARTDVGSDTPYQVTYFGHPLYMFIADKAAGQTNGENVAAFNGLWYLVTLSGRPAVGLANVSMESSAAGPVLATSTASSTTRSLYLLTTDPANLSSCSAGCARFWPPLLTSGAPSFGSGVNPSGLGTIRLPDGTQQVTYFGVPLYLFAFDLGAGAKSGLTNGEGFVDQAAFGVWYLVNASGAAQPAAATVSTGTTSFGTVLTDGKLPLYAFSADTAASSACSGACARVWTPYLTTGAPQAAASSSVTQSELGTIQRADGTTQVTYNGHPLYRFAADFTGVSGQQLAMFGGTFSLMQTAGTALTTMPTSLSPVAIPQLTSSDGGVSASFQVAFTSSMPGQATVNFGSGPGCAGLIETATQDSGSGTTNHLVTVTGNDLSGAMGDSGVRPGITYSYQVVTTGSTGQETNDNKGKCFTVTMPGFDMGG